MEFIFNFIFQTQYTFKVQFINIQYENVIRRHSHIITQHTFSIHV